LRAASVNVTVLAYDAMLSSPQVRGITSIIMFW